MNAKENEQIILGNAKEDLFIEIFIGFHYVVDLKAQTTIPIEEDHELLWMEPIEC